MIIALKKNVEGVLLACHELLDSPDSDLIYADTLDELKSKISFSGFEDDVRTLGFKPVTCLLYTSPSPRDRQKSRMPSSA